MSKVDFQAVTIIKVIVDGKHAGVIKEVTDGWAYFPKGSKTSGDTFTSQIACMRSLQ